MNEIDTLKGKFYSGVTNNTEKHEKTICELKSAHSLEISNLKSKMEGMEKELKEIYDKSQMTKFEKETLKFFEDKYLKSDSLIKVTLIQFNF